VRRQGSFGPEMALEGGEGGGQLRGQLLWEVRDFFRHGLSVHPARGRRREQAR
jgi:hypothetical protein